MQLNILVLQQCASEPKLPPNEVKRRRGEQYLRFKYSLEMEVHCRNLGEDRGAKRTLQRDKTAISKSLLSRKQCRFAIPRASSLTTGDRLFVQRRLRYTFPILPKTTIPSDSNRQGFQWQEAPAAGLLWHREKEGCTQRRRRRR